MFDAISLGTTSATYRQVLGNLAVVKLSARLKYISGILSNCALLMALRFTHARKCYLSTKVTGSGHYYKQLLHVDAIFVNLLTVCFESSLAFVLPDLIIIM